MEKKDVSIPKIVIVGEKTCSEVVMNFVEDVEQHRCVLDITGTPSFVNDPRVLCSFFVSF